MTFNNDSDINLIFMIFYFFFENVFDVSVKSKNLENIIPKKMFLQELKVCQKKTIADAFM